MKSKSGEGTDTVRTLEEQQETRAGVSNHGASVVAEPRQGLPRAPGWTEQERLGGALTGHQTVI